MTTVSAVASGSSCDNSSRVKNSEATDEAVAGAGSSMVWGSWPRPKSMDEGGLRGDGTAGDEAILRNELTDNFLCMLGEEKEGARLCVVLRELDVLRSRPGDAPASGVDDRAGEGPIFIEFFLDRVEEAYEGVCRFCTGELTES